MQVKTRGAPGPPVFCGSLPRSPRPASLSKGVSDGNPTAPRHDRPPVSAVRLREGLHGRAPRSEEHTSELQSLMRISYAVFCLKNKTNQNQLLLTPHCIHTSILTTHYK